MRHLNRKDLSKLSKKKDCKEIRVKSQRQRLMKKIELFNSFKPKYKNYKVTSKRKIRGSDFCRNS